MTDTKPSSISASLLVILSMISLTIGASLAKGLFAVLGPAGITFLRLSISAAILILIHRPWKNSMTRDQWRWTAAYGAILGSMNLLFYFAIARLPIGIAIAIEFLGPLSVALFLSRSKKDLLWAVLALIGVMLILPTTALAAPIDLLGVFFALCAAVTWALYILVGKKVGKLIPAGSVTAYGMLCGAILVAPVGLIPSIQILNHLALIPVALAIGVLSSAIPYTLEMRAMKNMESKTFGILLSLEPAIGAVSAMFLLNEMLSLTQMVAILCVMAASVGSVGVK